jgi:Protein kinase domain
LVRVDFVGQQWGNYRLIRLLGQGGFADVYLGEHVHLGKQAAIKIVQTTLSGVDALGFQHEARIISELNHPHIIRLLDFDLHENVPFLVLEYAPQGSLRDKHSRGMVVELELVDTYLLQVADALTYAHERKLIHRDIKPENMLIGRNGQILLGDFGMAASLQSTSSLQTKQAAGTLVYMAPEQIQGHSRAASDQYSLAIVVFEWLTGSLPFQGSPLEIMVQHLMTPPPSPTQLNAQLPSDLDQVLNIALAKDPHARFASVRAFATAFQQSLRTRSAVGLEIAPTGAQASTIAPADVTLALPQTPLLVSAPTNIVALPVQPTMVPLVWPDTGAPQVQSRSAAPVSQRRSWRRVALLVAALLILLSGSGFWYVYARQQASSINHVQHSVTVSSMKVKTATATVSVVAQATATAQPRTTAGATSAPNTQPTPVPTAVPVPTATPASSVSSAPCLTFQPSTITYTHAINTNPYIYETSAGLLYSCSSASLNWTSAITFNRLLASGDKWFGYSNPATGTTSGTLTAQGHAQIDYDFIVYPANEIAGTYTAVLTFAVGGTVYCTVSVTLTMTSS